MWYIQMANGVVLTSTASLPCPSATSSTFVVGEWTFCQFIQALQMLCLELQIALSYEKSRSFTIRIFILLSQKKSRLCTVLRHRCWATKPYLSRSCIVLVPCQLRHDSVWNRLNLLQTINAYSKRVVFVLYLPRQCSATKPLYCSWVLSRFIRSRWITLKYFIFGYCKVLQRSKLATKCKFLSGEGFEPSISMRVRLKLTALDRSANLTFYIPEKSL